MWCKYLWGVSSYVYVVYMTKHYGYKFSVVCVCYNIAGSLYLQLFVRPGEEVAKGSILMTVEGMKMEVYTCILLCNSIILCNFLPDQYHRHTGRPGKGCFLQ